MWKLNASFLAAVVLALALNSNAQSAAVSGFAGTVQPIQAIGEVSAQPDTIVSVAAESQGLSPIAREDLPRGGTYWWVQPGGQAVPTPFPSTDMSQTIYQITDGQFLVDQTGGAVVVQRRQLGSRTAADSIATAATAQVGAVVNLINQVLDAEDNRQMQSMMRSMGIDVPSPGDGGGYGGGGDYTNNYVAYTFDTNSLWLEITNVSNGWSYLNLHNATNLVYAIESTTDLTGGWNVETELWPSGDQTNLMPFSIQNFGRQDLFFRAQDWTGVDSDSDGIPDWWIWKYFGNLSENATNVDLNGNTLLYDYTNSYVPVVFNFTSLEVPNNYVSTLTPSVQLNVTGSPYYLATLIDDNNFSNAVWNNYSSSSVTVNLGATEGWHGVWIGIRGHADDTSAAVWKYKRLKLDTTPPQLTLTSPTNDTVDVPVIQLTGFSPESLSSISYDLTNALGLVTNQPILITDQSYSTATWEFTTSQFQGFDIPLTNGVNTFTIHATDLAGNMTTLATNFTLTYSNKPAPVVQLLWPVGGMEIVGSDIVCRGSVSDPTASVTVQLVDATGATNNAGSLVGRDGIFYADNLTLATGTNYLSYTVTDAAGNVATTNITVMTSDLGLTLDTVVAGQTEITGTIDDDSYTIYVNGVVATNDGFGNWSATIAPISGTGGAVVVNAVNGGDPTLQQIVQSPQGVYMNASNYKQVENFYGDQYQEGESHWADNAGGSSTGERFDGSTLDTFVAWPASLWPEALPWGILWGTNNGVYAGHTMRPAGISFHHEHANVAAQDVVTGSSFTELADGVLKFATGGPVGSTIKRLWQLSGSVTVDHNPTPDLDEVPWSMSADPETIADQRVSLGSLGNLNANGNLFVMLEDNTRPVVLPKIGGADQYHYPNPTVQVVTINSLTVVSNATQIDATNWACVKTPTNDWVYVQIALSTDDTNVANFIQWSAGDPVPGNPWQRRVTKTVSTMTPVSATLGSSSTNLNVWVIWADLTIKTSGTLDPEDKATILVNGSWPTPTINNIELSTGNGLGGGSELGVIDCLSNTNLDYAYTIGKMEAKAILYPAGIGNLITNGWDMKRTKIKIAWDNGGLPSSSALPPGADDTSPTFAKYLNPANGDIFDLDGPGCSNTLGLGVNHTAELYENFYERVTVNLGGGDQTCSATNTWSYQAQVDVDATNKVEFNSLSTSSITIPTTSHYTHR